MTFQRTDDADLERQANVARIVGECHGLRLVPFIGVYAPLDYYGVNAEGGIAAVYEVKVRTCMVDTYATVWLPTKKWWALMGGTLIAETAWFVVAWADGAIRAIEVGTVPRQRAQRFGGTPPGHAPRADDHEPGLEVPISLMTPLQPPYGF